MPIKAFLYLVIAAGFLNVSNTFASEVKNMPIPLPKVTINKDFSLDHAIAKRRSTRSFLDIPLTKQQISQLLWAGQGITDKRNFLRAAPSAGALYPIQLYIIKNDGIWLYSPHKHSLKNILDKDSRKLLSKYCLNQSAVKDAAADIVIVADYGVVAKKYGDRAVRYTHLEVGHVAQNILLEAVALGLSAVPIGAFIDSDIQRLMNLSRKQNPLYVISIGYKVKTSFLKVAR